jgi:SAM-dependent methyltransferase
VANLREVDLAANHNIDETTVASFGDEWSRFDQSKLDGAELNRIFACYFRIFPWHTLPLQAEGFDMGCGSGRWAKLVLPRVGLLHCIDASEKALEVARRNLATHHNANFLCAAVNSVPLRKSSQDFGYSLGVLHHVPDTLAAMSACVELLKPGAPFLVYLYYRFDNRPAWFRMLWQASELVRACVSSLPARLKSLVTDAIAVLIYWPLARLSWLGDKLGLNFEHWPLYGYRNLSFYTMRTDSRDRFGTPLEQRFTREEIRRMMENAGLEDIVFSDREPFWCAVGVKPR